MFIEWSALLALPLYCGNFDAMERYAVRRDRIRIRGRWGECGSRCRLGGRRRACATALSLDRRMRVLAAVHGGLSRRAAGERFGVGWRVSVGGGRASASRATPERRCLTATASPLASMPTRTRSLLHSTLADGSHRRPGRRSRPLPQGSAASGASLQPQRYRGGQRSRAGFFSGTGSGAEVFIGGSYTHQGYPVPLHAGIDLR